MTVQYMCDAESCHTFQCDNESRFGIYLDRHNYPRNNSILPPTWKLNAINQFEDVIRPASRVNRLRHGRLPLGSGELRLVPRSKLIVKLAEEGLMIFLIWFEINYSKTRIEANTECSIAFVLCIEPIIAGNVHYEFHAK